MVTRKQGRENRCRGNVQLPHEVTDPLVKVFSGAPTGLR